MFGVSTLAVSLPISCLPGREPCSKKSSSPWRGSQRRRRGSATYPTIPPGRKSSCERSITAQRPWKRRWCSALHACLCLCRCRAMMMTACDLSAITKPWEVQSKVRARPRACHLVLKHPQFPNTRWSPRWLWWWPQSFGSRETSRGQF